MNKGRQRTTLSDVAREAGVSRATVGFVLSNDPHQTISPATRAKVQQAARRLGYQSFAPARLLRTGRSSIVLLVIHTIHIAPITSLNPAVSRMFSSLVSLLRLDTTHILGGSYTDE